MTSVSVLVPFRADGAERDTAWAYLQRWWAEAQPDWQVVTGTCPPGPWVKAYAVQDALTRADGELLLIADADVFMDRQQLGMWASTLQASSSRAWIIPHRTVMRLTPAGTAAVLAGEEPPVDNDGGGYRPNPLIERCYKGVGGGGMVMLSRDLYESVPLDPRFAGWGQEDQSLNEALGVLGGSYHRGGGTLYHLWHPPQPRLNDVVGSDESQAHYQRYLAARTPELMRALVDEARELLSVSGAGARLANAAPAEC